MTFKVGDKVKITDDSGSYKAKGRIGEIGEVKRVDRTLVTVIMSDGAQIDMVDHRFELVNDNTIAPSSYPESTYKIGDKIRSKMSGDILLIDNIVRSSQSYSTWQYKLTSPTMTHFVDIIDIDSDPDIEVWEYNTKIENTERMKQFGNICPNPPEIIDPLYCSCGSTNIVTSSTSVFGKTNETYTYCRNCHKERL